MAEKDVSTGPEEVGPDEQEQQSHFVDTNHVEDGDKGNIPFPTDGRVESTIEGVDSDAVDFAESNPGNEEHAPNAEVDAEVNEEQEPNA